MAATAFDLRAHGRAMRAQGYWLDQTYEHFLAASVAATPDKTALVAWRADRAEPTRLTYREFDERVGHAAVALRALGVGRGDVVAVQMPNGWEFVVASYACFRLGAVFNPLMPIFRERELSYMLGFSEAKVLVVPRVFRGFDHEAMARSLQAELPKLKHLVVVDGTGKDSFDRLLMSGQESLSPTLSATDALLEPDDLAVLMFTSGTTGFPKGVMHTSNALIACNNALAGRFGLGPDDVLLTCSPVGHMTGYAAGVLLGLRLGATVVLQDIWEAQRGVSIMANENVTFTAASTPFLTDICDTVKAGATRPAQLRNFLCGGAPIPPVMIERAAAELDLRVCSLWGMTEALSGTLTEPEMAATKSATTDGRAADGVEVQIADTDGMPLPVGQTGRLMVRGAQMFQGYYKQSEIPTFDEQGWFDTGDLAWMDSDGYIRINGRTKDVVIRGGENIPVFEIESLLHKHPAVARAALVGYPDARLGERVCAFIVLRGPEAELDLRGVQAWMETNKVARQYWPERVKILVELPSTPSGKVQKFRLREMASTPD